MITLNIFNYISIELHLVCDWINCFSLLLNSFIDNEFLIFNNYSPKWRWADAVCVLSIQTKKSRQPFRKDWSACRNSATSCSRRQFSTEEPLILEWTRIPSDTCGRANSIWKRYVWTGKFLHPKGKSCGFKNIRIRVDGAYFSGNWCGAMEQLVCFQSSLNYMVDHIYTLFFYKNAVFPVQAEYSYFSADFRL